MLKRPNHFYSRAITLVEVLVATGLLTVMMAGITALNTTCRTFVRSQREAALASYTLEYAEESLRARNWSQLTNATQLQTWMQGLSCDGLQQLDQVEFTATISPFPPLSPNPAPLVLKRSPGNPGTLVSQPPAGFPLRAMPALQVELQIKWSFSGKTRVREGTAVISQFR